MFGRILLNLLVLAIALWELLLFLITDLISLLVIGWARFSIFFYSVLENYVSRNVSIFLVLQFASISLFVVVSYDWIVQLTFEKQWFEMHGFIYMWISFNNKYYSTTRPMIG